jgi:hypothetical protein
MKKVLFILSDHSYIRNFFDTNIIEKIKSNFELHLIKRENIQEDKIKDYQFKNYSKDPQQKFKTTLFDLYVNFYKEKSRYFKFRLKRFYRFDLRYLNELCLQNNENDNFINKNKRFYILIKNFFIFALLMVLSSRKLFKITLNFFEKKIKINKSFENLVDEDNYDIILMPTNGYSSEVYDLLKLSKKKNLKLNFVIDNWDNLSSKMIFFEKPDKIFVWGEQTSKHAENIHKISQKNIFKIGSARYENFFQNRDKNLKNYFNHKYILFLGSSWSWDEEATLTYIDEIIENNKKIFSNLKIIYRYHPFRQRKNKINPNWKNIVIDPQLISTSQLKGRRWPDLNYYPSLIKNCEFVVGGFTTMLLETTIFYKKYIGIGYDDDKSLLNQKNALKHFEHLDGIEELPNLEICYNKFHLKNLIIKSITKPKIYEKKTIDDAREHFLTYDPNKTYGDKLIEYLKK